ncbi:MULTISPECIES: transglutaminase family protein [Sorangium]|uniref:TransglutaminaseTgpA domain-containing protein n=1 Tax=Sorangium atrum TaxID=2995308 RepID=A0ABT5CB96_9BACT|nr:transglutaminaseTgpA domain-containing protein [Sorangium aterium]MDC0683701.1 transglutaminaseTgpA domain-containing protein [Sorangium aterium]
MRFGMVHRVMTDALAALGVIALVASGQFNRYVSWAILISLGLALVVRESWQRHPALRHLDTGILLAVIAVQVVRIVATDASVLDVLVEFAAALQIIRLATRKGAAHDQQVIVLALLHLIAGTVLGGGMGYGLCFLGVLVVAPGALVLSHLRREVEGNYRQGARDRTGLPVDVPRILRSRRVVGRSFLAVTCLLSVPIFVFTALLFVIFPRVGLSLLLLNRGHTGRMIGFSGKVDLGAVGVLRSDPKLAMRVEIPELPEPPPPRLTMHLRGTALDAYDGRTWTQSETFKRPTESDGGLVPIERYPDPAVDPVMRIDLEPIDPPVIFLPPNATGLRLKHRGQLGVDANAMAQRGPEGELRYQPTDDRGLVYDVFLSRKRSPTFQRLPAAERRRYLDLPRDLPSRVVELAQQWTQGVDRPADRARAIQEHLRTEYRYDLASPSGADPQPLDHFLFESKRGHCEFYSTAMAILLRAVDVPTRNVTGFVGGTYNRFGRFYAVRQGDAHSWVEVYLDGEGWMTFDPTPPADAAPKSELVGAWAYLRDFIEATSQRWDRHVVGYDLNQQVGLLQTLTSRYRRSGSSSDLSLSRPRILAVAAVALALGGGLLYWRFRRTRRGREERRADAGRTPSAILATALYEGLEAAMLVQGVPRPPSLPPLRHAEALELADHPLAREILTLTQVYLRARFGGATLTEDDSRDFERRVKALRGAERRARAASDSGLAASP